MKRPTLRSITIENFRSIDGRVEVPLNAPVVLVHALNGTGKTSLFSAIEIAVAGQISSLERVDPGYRRQLLNFGKDEGRIDLFIDNLPKYDRLQIDIREEGFRANQQLSPDLVRFYGERCYLAQSLLSQLLTIYQEADPGAHSPLSRFVHELLGLDRLDALETGIEKAHDLRNTRRLVPAYIQVETEVQRADGEVNRKEIRRDELVRQKEDHESVLRVSLTQLGQELPTTINGRAQLLSTLQATSEEQAIIELIDLRRQLEALDRDLGRQTSASRALNVLSRAHELALGDLEGWRQANEARITRCIQDAWALLPGEPEYSAAEDPIGALEEVTLRLGNEAARLDGILKRDTPLRERHSQLVEREASLVKRSAEIAPAISEISRSAGSLSALMAELVQHIDGDICPVCDRDFNDVDPSIPLRVHVSDKARKLSNLADDLARLVAERGQVERDLEEVRREISGLAGHLLDPLTVGTLRGRSEAIGAAKLVVANEGASAQEGGNLVRSASSARAELLAAQHQDQRAQELREALGAVCVSLRQAPPAPTEMLDVAISRVREFIGKEELRLRNRAAARASALERLEALQSVATDLTNANQQLTAAREKAQRLSSHIKAAERVRAMVRQLKPIISDSRREVVRRVFNEQLNRLWRDLFVRLAPAEAFVPAFHVPGDDEPVHFPLLETHHRSGGRGGTPGAMLSAGNLNTAALTLFLALHLSVTPKLPWLLLDDPVQSMDDVHVAQFSALLRTLSKEHGRQILIAVHDRQLFEYLTLELSPAFAGDQLLTVDLERSDKATTVARHTRLEFTPETAIRLVA